jgi:hypothetical protein
MRLLLSCLLGLTLTACSDPVSFFRRTLPLAEVDNTALPVTLASGTGTVQVIGGSLETALNGVCSWTVSLSGGTTRTGTVPECVFDLDERVTLTLDLGGPPAPTGSHAYEFGVAGE